MTPTLSDNMAHYDKEYGIVLSEDDKAVFKECSQNVTNGRTSFSENIMKWVKEGKVLETNQE